MDIKITDRDGCKTIITSESGQILTLVRYGKWGGFSYRIIDFNGKEIFRGTNRDKAIIALHGFWKDLGVSCDLKRVFDFLSNDEFTMSKGLREMIHPPRIIPSVRAGMDEIRIVRLASVVAEKQFPRIEFNKTVQVGDQTIQVWVVDGEYIRTYVDEEFTNFGQHYRFPFIPENEFWLDRENENNESSYFIEHLKVEWKLMRDGKDYETAITEADEVEKQLRRKSGDISKVIDPVRKLVDAKLFREKILKKLGNGVTVWLVHGDLVRTVLDLDFTQGGHELVYSWIPPGDVWIDNDLEWQERGFVILHEIHERNLMEKGMCYDDAHASSSALEQSCRIQIDNLQDALMAEGWG